MQILKFHIALFSSDEWMNGLWTLISEHIVHILKNKPVYSSGAFSTLFKYLEAQYLKHLDSAECCWLTGKRGFQQVTRLNGDVLKVENISFPVHNNKEQQ